MKKVLCTVLAVVMAVVCFAGCSAPAAEGGNEAGGSAASGDTIKVGLLGPYTGDLAVYGLAVKNGATLYFDKINAEGGINGKKIELISYDNKGDDAEAINAFNRELLASHIRTCVRSDIQAGNDEVIDELLSTLQKLMK